MSLGRSRLGFSQFSLKWRIAKWWRDELPCCLLNFHLEFDLTKVPLVSEPLALVSELPEQPEPPEPVAKKARAVENQQFEFKCSICNDKLIDCCLGCGHCACLSCAAKLINCHMCREKISLRTKMFL